MREIKFRAWNKDIEKMCDPEPIQGWLLTQMKTGRVEEILQIEPEEDAQEAYSHLVFMQYTGLKDKNGKEIYEGDIVKHQYEKGIAVVKFGEGYQGEPADGMYPYWGWYTDGWFDRYAFGEGELEIIGNIYENPDMLP